jgi:hypothetical protein
MKEGLLSTEVYEMRMNVEKGNSPADDTQAIRLGEGRQTPPSSPASSPTTLRKWQDGVRDQTPSTNISHNHLRTPYSSQRTKDFTWPSRIRGAPFRSHRPNRRAGPPDYEFSLGLPERLPGSRRATGPQLPLLSLNLSCPSPGSSRDARGISIPSRR